MADQEPNFKALIALVADGNSLNVGQARTAFDIMMSGNATPSQMGAFLMALRVRGESVNEITGGVMVMRERMTKLNPPSNAMDIVGTGGDGTGTLNISTAATFVVAGCGVPIAKHGNRAASSKSGTTDVQSALGINAGRDGHTHDLQHPGSDVDSGWRKTTVDRGFQPGLDSTHGGSLENTRI